MEETARNAALLHFILYKLNGRVTLRHSPGGSAACQANALHPAPPPTQPWRLPGGPWAPRRLPGRTRTQCAEFVTAHRPSFWRRKAGEAWVWCEWGKQVFKGIATHCSNANILSAEANIDSSHHFLDKKPNSSNLTDLHLKVDEVNVDSVFSLK